MSAVAAGAVGGTGGTEAGREPMVAFEEGLEPVGGEAVFRVDALGGVAAAADLLGEFDGGHLPQYFNPVFRVTISAGGRLPFAPCQGAAMDALFDLGGLFGVAGAASRRQMGALQRGIQLAGGSNAMAAMAILARGGGDLAVASGQGMRAAEVALRRLLVTDGAVYGLDGNTIVGMSLGDFPMAGDA